MNESTTIKIKGFSIFTKLLSGFILVLALTGIGNFYSFYQIEHLNDLTTQMHEHHFRETRTLLGAIKIVAKIQFAMKYIALSQTNVDIVTELRIIDENEKEVYRQLEIAKQLITGDDGTILLAEIVRQFQDWKSIRDEIIALIYSENRSKALAIVQGKEKHLVELLHGKMEKLEIHATDKALDS